MSARQFFDEREEQYIREHWGNSSAGDIAKHLGRSVSGVRKFARKIGCQMRKCSRWTGAEDKVLLGAAGRTIADVASELGRSVSECSNRARVLGIKSWAWHKNGGKFKPKRGYTVIGFSRRDGDAFPVFEHIAVMEERIGRAIQTPEVVHHINGVKSDNRPENLYLCRDAAHHRMVHFSIERCLPSLIEAGIITFNPDKGVYEVCKTVK